MMNNYVRFTFPAFFFCFVLSLFPVAAGADSVVVINEIMYHPSDSSNIEWIEVENLLAIDMDISDWSLRGGVGYTFPDGTIIPAEGYLVVTDQPALLAVQTGRSNITGPFTGSLSNSGEEILLYNNSDRLMDSVDYRDGGEWPVSPDGSGVSLARGPQGYNADSPRNWTWSSQMEGTPGVENFASSLTPAQVSFNELAGVSDEDFWIELVNYGSVPFDLTGCKIVCQGASDFTYTFASETLNAGSYRLVTQLHLGQTPADEDRLFLVSADGNCVLDGAVVKNSARARFPEGTGKWQSPDIATPAAANSFAFNEDIVINEIMYNHSSTVEGGESREEWIELYNKGSQTIDLNGWKLEDAVDFEFTQGTQLAAGGYLLVVRDAALMGAKYPLVSIAGEYDGSLSNSGERITLLDSAGNIADQVEYYDGFPWPENADGFHSSLELIDPKADNSNSAAWQASNEGSKLGWQTYTYTGVAQASRLGPDGQWQEFILGMLEMGEILIDDISVNEDPQGTPIQLIQNGTFESGTAVKWRVLGTHGTSSVVTDPDNPSNHVLRLIASGPGEHMHNHLETTLANGRTIVNGRTYQISFRAKWISGCNLLNSRLYFNRLARVTALPQPEYNGTPGLQNSRYQSNIGPTCSELIHSPAVPNAGQPVTVSVQAADPDGITAMTLRWRLDGQSWNSLTMSSAGNGLYQAVIPGQAAAAIVQFYIQGTDGPGAVSFWPAAGTDSRALYQVNDGRAATNGLHNMRIILLSADYNWLMTNYNLMSNGRIGCTVIRNEEEICYDTGVRLKGSQRHRRVPEHIGYNIKFPDDKLFGGVHGTIALDRSEGNLQGQREMLANIVLNRVGRCQLSKYSDLVQVTTRDTVHSGSAELQMARLNSEFLSSQFDSGGDGDLFEFEFIYYPRYTVSGNVEDYKILDSDKVVTNTVIANLGDEKENYRWTYLIKNNLENDDYSNLIQFAKQFSTTGSTFQNQVEDLIDVDHWLRMFAIANSSGSGDNYGVRNVGHNMFLYRRPADQKFLFFMHDLDNFYTVEYGILVNEDLIKIYAVPAYERLYLGHLYDVVQTAYNTAYMQHWADQLGQLLPAQTFASHLSFITQRSAYLLGQIDSRCLNEYPFEVTDPDFSVEDNFATIHGNGWINVKEIYLQGYDNPLELSWTASGSGTTRRYYWTTTVPLEAGPNLLTFTAHDFQGNPIGTDTITVTNTAAVFPLRDWLRVTEVMYDPIGGDDYEFIELCNTGPQTLDLTGVQFVETDGEGILLSFDAGTVHSLNPGEHVLVVKNLAVFSTRYNTAGLKIAGEYTGKLSNSGETLTLRGPWNSSLLSFAYSDSRLWPLAADGPGHSLVAVDLDGQAQGSLDYSGNWRASTWMHGSPGTADPQVPFTLVINEVMVHTDYSNLSHPEYDSNDWIELYNPTASAVVIAANTWYLSDESDWLAKWAIPAMTIPAYGIVTFDEVSGFHNPITQGFGLDKAGEEVYLSCLPASGPQRVVDSVEFKGQSADFSLGRYPNGSNNWGTMDSSRDQSNLPPVDQVFIRELMAAPPLGGYEYLELYNPTGQAVSLWDPQTGTGWRMDGGITYSFDVLDSIPANGVLLLVDFEPNAVNTEAFESFYNPVPVVIRGPYSGNLSDTGERIALEQPQDSDDPLNPTDLSWIIHDEVNYFHLAPWPTGARETGLALHRKTGTFDGIDPQSWYISEPTPGAAAADFNFDGTVNLTDFAEFAAAWLLESTDPGWNARADLSPEKDGIVDISDLAELASQWIGSH
jgi:hypothetical protein